MIVFSTKYYILLFLTLPLYFLFKNNINTNVKAKRLYSTLWHLNTPNLNTRSIFITYIEQIQIAWLPWILHHIFKLRSLDCPDYYIIFRRFRCVSNARRLFVNNNRKLFLMFIWFIFIVYLVERNMFGKCFISIFGVFIFFFKIVMNFFNWTIVVWLMFGH